MVILHIINFIRNINQKQHYGYTSLLYVSTNRVLKKRKIEKKVSEEFH